MTATIALVVTAILVVAGGPWIVLRFAVRWLPPADPRRAEYLGEYDAVDWWARPLWVGDLALRCLRHERPLRLAHRRIERAKTWSMIQPTRGTPPRLLTRGYSKALVPPFCFFLGLPWAVIASMAPVNWSFIMTMGDWGFATVILSIYAAGRATVELPYHLAHRRRVRRRRRSIALLARADS